MYTILGTWTLREATAGKPSLSLLEQNACTKGSYALSSLGLTLHQHAPEHAACRSQFLEPYVFIVMNIEASKCRSRSPTHPILRKTCSCQGTGVIEPREPSGCSLTGASSFFLNSGFETFSLPSTFCQLL